MKSILMSGILTAMFMAVGCSGTDDKTADDLLFACSGYAVYGDSIRQGDMTIVCVPGAWDVESHFPVFVAEQTVPTVAYALAADRLAELDTDSINNTDKTHAVYLSLAYLIPEESMQLLRGMVRDGRIAADDGIGGSWPVVSDRIAWAVAAWEVYAVTGNRQWLSEAYDVIRATLADDARAVYDPVRKLMHGSVSYFDNLGEVYPEYMLYDPTRVYASMTLGGNALFVRAYEILSLMVAELELDAAAQDGPKAMSQQLKHSVNSLLWQPAQGYYSSFLYGEPYCIPAPTTDNVGQALCILFDIAEPEMAEMVIERTPTLTIGTPGIFPRLSSHVGFLYSSLAQSYWCLAAAKARNMDALEAALGSRYLHAANTDSRGEFFRRRGPGTIFRESATLIDASGEMATAFRIYAGMRFSPGGIEFHPVVPRALKGEKSIRGFSYRDATLDITIEGTGDKIASFSIDGEMANDFIFPADRANGHHTIVVTMSNNSAPEKPFNMLTESGCMAGEPLCEEIGRDSITIAKSGNDIEHFNLWVNGVLDRETTDSIIVFADNDFRQLNVTETGRDNYTGFSMPTLWLGTEGRTTVLKATDFAKGGTQLIEDKEASEAVVEVSTTRHTSPEFSVDTLEAGSYWVYAVYSNGSGPLDSGNSCAIRTLTVNGNMAGTIVMPQTGDWQRMSRSNLIAVRLRKGRNTLALEYETPYNVNMNQETNTALIQSLTLIKK